VLRRGRPEAQDLALEHAAPPLAVEGHAAVGRGMPALPAAEVDSRGVPDLRLLPRPPGHRGLTTSTGTAPAPDPLSTSGTTRPAPPVRVALDLLGGDGLPEQVAAVVVEGALRALAADPGLAITLVGPPAVAATALAAAGAAPGAVAIAAATQVVGMDEDPARAVRAKRDATVRVAARLVRDGEADACCSLGSTGAAMAAALFTLGRLPGVTRPALALTLPSSGGPVVFLDAGAGTEAGVDLLVQFALAGVALARVRLGLADPRVGLLSVGEEPGKGDLLRKQAYDALAALSHEVGGPLRFVGNVEGSDVPLGDRVDVVVTDGFTGNVLIKGMEGAVQAVARRLAEALTATPERREAGRTVLSVFAGLASEMGAEGLGGGVLLGVKGVVVVGHGSSSPLAVASALAAAAQAAREGLVPGVAAAFADLVARRRQAAGLPPTPATPPAGVDSPTAPVDAEVSP